MTKGRFKKALEETNKIALINKWNSEVQADITNAIKWYAQSFKPKSYRKELI
jgi:hypothetical protein